MQITRRGALRFGAALAISRPGIAGASASGPLRELGYSDVRLLEGPMKRQLEASHLAVMNLSEDSLLRPFRQREGLPAPGQDLGGWYDTWAFAPGATYGQWLSSLARYYAITGDGASREKAARLVRGYAQTASPQGKFYVRNRFPSYTYDKLVCGLVDAALLTNDPDARAALRRATDAAWSYLPERAFARQETPVLHDEDYTRHCWDESYTLPENQFLAHSLSGDPRHLDLGKRLLYDDGFFDPLSRNENVLPGKHAYSHVNALSSAARAYLALNNPKYLRAAVNGFAMVQAQSYATGGWGPDEHFFPPGSGHLAETLSSTHSNFETPCGAYAHLKITRYLLRLTRDSRYGDSMERVLYNTVLGARPIQPDGRAFYYSDYNQDASKFFHPDKWPCCSGTLPQVTADYGISSYFADPSGLWVNLYSPSMAKWNGCSLRQTTNYPYEETVRLEIDAPQPSTFSLHLRVPDWAREARLTVPNQRGSRRLEPGAFAEVRREWKRGDRVELELPLAMRLEPVDAQHPNTVALLAGPLVLMPVGNPSTPLTRTGLLSAHKSAGSRAWTAGSLQLLPFPDITDEHYSVYSRVS